MKLLRFAILLVAFSVCALVTPASARATVCNERGSDYFAIVAEQNAESGRWWTKGFFFVPVSECTEVGGQQDQEKVRVLFVYPKESGTTMVLGPDHSGFQGCVQLHMQLAERFEFPEMSKEDCEAMGMYYEYFWEIDQTGFADCEILLHQDRIARACAELPDQIKTYEDRCLFSWSDSHQLHSSELVIDWNYQAWHDVWKRLEHCVRLKAVGPVDLKEIGGSFVQGCIDKAVNDDKVRYIVQALVAVAIDIKTGTKGGAFAATLAEYIDNVQDEAVECLTDVEALQATVVQRFKDSIQASIVHETHWEYWSP